MLHTVDVKAELLRRLPDGTWPMEAQIIEAGTLTLDSIGFKTELAAVYRTTRLAGGD